MAGRTGKLTNDALRSRGPRLVLAEGEQDDKRFMVIFREGQSCFSSGFGHADFVMESGGRYTIFRTMAKSYTLNYLLKIGRINARVK